jgi:hypothetical protein
MARRIVLRWFLTRRQLVFSKDWKHLYQASKEIADSGQTFRLQECLCCCVDLQDKLNRVTESSPFSLIRKRIFDSFTNHHLVWSESRSQLVRR